MPITVNLRPGVHRKVQELCAFVPGNTAAGSFFAFDKSNLIPGHDNNYFMLSTSAFYEYNVEQDAYINLVSPTITGTFGAGACGESRSLGAPAGNQVNTATAGTTTSVTTSLTLVRNLPGVLFRVVAGTGVGYSGTVLKNTLGANSIITLTVANGVAFDATTQFQLYSGSLWVFNPGSVAVGFSVYDRATNVWTARSVTNLPTAFVTDGSLVGTLGAESNRGNGFVNATSTGTNTTTTLNDTTKAFPANGWSNAQVRIVSGTGAGQIRAIASNTATALTVSVAWTVTPDATSVYRIEGNDDYLYLAGNAAVTLYRYTISTNTWAAMTPVTARSGAAGAGLSMNWIDGVQNADWSDGTYTNHYLTTIIKQNGRYIYSFRGGASSILDVYDIAANTFVNDILYGNKSETITTGSGAVDLDGTIYCKLSLNTRLLKFTVANNTLDAFLPNIIPEGTTAVSGQKLGLAQIVDGATRLTYLYIAQNSRSEFSRVLVI